MSARDHICVALDRMNSFQAVDIIEAAHQFVGWYKFTPALLMQRGGNMALEYATRKGAKPFVDFKIHDIPSTARDIAAELVRVGAKLLTVHAEGGVNMIRQVTGGLSNALPPGHRTLPKVVAVTVLTSVDEASWRERMACFGSNLGMRAYICHLAKQAKNGGADGVVCGAKDVPAIKEVWPQAFCVTPGIRYVSPLDSAGDDQGKDRVVTPRVAINMASNLLVIGRPIHGNLETTLTTVRHNAEVIHAEVEDTLRAPESGISH